MLSTVPALRVAVLLVVLCFTANAMGQTESATVSGRVTDTTGALVPRTEVQIQSVERGTVRTATTNEAGIYIFPGIQPGQYHMTVQKEGFRRIEFVGLIVNVQDHVEKNFSLQLGSVSESITVSGGVSLVNTESAAVSTVVDRTYVENMPLNGRSFQDLILLTPGVVTNSPQTAGFIGNNGEFSVNGQRTESNYYSVDGVSANVGANSGFASYGTPGLTGSLPAPTALGTTHSLVSVDALEEFRVQSSTYSAEYGRNPGGQFSFTTRSGTNDWHGAAFDYLRNGAFDANDWFNDYLRLPSAPLRQQDFGGTLGGPVQIPHLYQGKDKTFFFISYEGLRVVQPHPATVNYVPDATLRQSPPGILRAVLNAFPVANGPQIVTSCDPGSDPACPPTRHKPSGLAEFISTWSDPSEVNATSVRLDHNVGERLRLFFRFSETPSTASTRGTLFETPSNNLVSTYVARTYTLGTTSLLGPRIDNEFRLSSSSNDSLLAANIDPFGGSTHVDLLQAQGFTSPFSNVAVALSFPSRFVFMTQTRVKGVQRQWNLVNTLGVAVGRHQLKFGLDYRRLTPVAKAADPSVTYFYSSADSVQANSPDFVNIIRQVTAYPLYQNFAAFAADEWKAAPRFNLSVGLRWEVNPAPGVTRGLKPYTVLGSDLSTLTLAREGTPLWKTAWFNFAPRFGAVYILRDEQDRQTVVRGGAGLFFDTGQQTGSAGFGGPGFQTQVLVPPGVAAFPLPVTEVTPPIVNPPVAPYSTTVFAFPTHLQLPYTLQWNVSIQQALGKSQAFTVSYVGSRAGRLIEQEVLQGGTLNPNFVTNGLSLFRGDRTADYNSLQTQFQRRFSAGLQVLASYTWSHSIDYGSTNAFLAGTRGSSDYDVRHNFSGAMSYELPPVIRRGVVRAIISHWGADDRFTARTGFPVSLDGVQIVDPFTGKTFNSGLDVMKDQPVYIYGSKCAAVYANGSGCPGGWAVNPNAFSVPSSGFGNAPRNFVRGFGAWQMDLAIRREFPIHDRLKLQFRAESFNVFNHPNFGTINSHYCTAGSPACTFGQATSTLAQGLGILSPLYQTGGPRSAQFALKLLF
jgi:hypothetical protein